MLVVAVVGPITEVLAPLVLEALVAVVMEGLVRLETQAEQILVEVEAEHVAGTSAHKQAATAAPVLSS